MNLPSVESIRKLCDGQGGVQIPTNSVLEAIKGFRFGLTGLDPYRLETSSGRWVAEVDGKMNRVPGSRQTGKGCCVISDD